MTDDNTPEPKKSNAEISGQLLGSDKGNPKSMSEKGAGEILSDIIMGTPGTTSNP